MAKKTAASGSSETGASTSPARGSKSEAIRDYLSQNPKAPSKSVIEALKAQGIDVSLALVGAIKYGSGKKKSKGKAGRPRKTAAAATTAAAPAAEPRGRGLTAADLLEAKALADKLGGLNAARKALEMLEQLK